MIEDEVAKVVSETIAAIAAGKDRPGQKITLGTDLMESQVRDIEIKKGQRSTGGGGAGQDNFSERAEGLKPWQIYWDRAAGGYAFYDPRIVTPDGTIVAKTVAIEANKTYTAQIWQDSEGTWNAEIVTEVKTREEAVSETNVQIAVVGNIKKPNEIKQRHIGAIVVGGDGGVTVTGTDGVAVKGTKFTIESEPDTNLTAKCEKGSDGTICIKIGVYWKRT